MKNGPVLTVGHLKARGACDHAIARFRARFGDFVVVTESVCAGVSEEFPWWWAATHLLPDDLKNEYILRRDSDIVACKRRVNNGGKCTCNADKARAFGSLAERLVR